METFLGIVISGLLMGGLYALIAMGLSLQYGVARVLNVSHGEFIMLGALTTWTLYTAFHINPLLSLAVCGPLAFALGFVLHRTVYRRIMVSSPSPGAFEGNSLLASFGLLFVIQNVALFAWGPEIRGYTYLAVPVDVAGVFFGANRLLTLACALAIGVTFYIFLARTRIGKAIRAASQDSTTAALMGVNIHRVLALCFGLGAGLAAVAGMLLSLCYPVHAVMGIPYTVIAMIVVVLGGLGSIPGSFLGGLVLGLVGSLLTYWEPALTLVAYYLIFALLLLVRPTGIMGR
jgi:branched-chain amino acid transport system permease protein